jgi:hypothetical protein
MATDPRRRRYGRIRDQLAGLLGKVADPVARRATAVALLHHKVPGVSWTGFYLLRGGDLVVDVDTGTYGHRISMMDFKPSELVRFREIGKIVGIEDRPGQVTTALSISGSAAQGKIQAYPGDCDFFERVHVTAPTREEACRIIGDVIRDKALTSFRGPTHRLWEVKFGSYPFDGERDGKPVKRGGPVTWRADEVVTGRFDLRRADGSAAVLTWKEAGAEPGWCKLDRIVSDPARQGLANASNMLDVTWEASDGTITALDGFVDPYFQEVYLEPESLPVFERLIKLLKADAVDEYVRQLEHEVHKYVVDAPNYGKAARRMYNIFRLTGRYADAAYIRELFDEPATALYQLAALVRTVDEAAAPGGDFDTETMVRQVDSLIMAAIAALDGPAEAQVVAHLRHVRDSVGRLGQDVDRSASVEAVTSEALAAVNTYFKDRLEAVDSIRAYLDGIRAGEGTGAA